MPFTHVSARLSRASNLNADLCTGDLGKDKPRALSQYAARREREKRNDQTCPANS